MAKVGNEVKLILSLAREHMRKRRDALAGPDATQYYAGWMSAHNCWLSVLDEIVRELESGR